MENYIILDNTLLQKIYKDLWPIIQKYYDSYPLFGIGKLRETYPGYRLINNDDINNESFDIVLEKFYNRSMAVKLFSFSGVGYFYNTAHLCGDNIDVYIDEYPLRCWIYTDIEYHLVAQLFTCVNAQMSNNINFQNVKANLYFAGKADRELGLFILI